MPGRVIRSAKPLPLFRSDRASCRTANGVFTVILTCTGAIAAAGIFGVGIVRHIAAAVTIRHHAVTCEIIPLHGAAVLPIVQTGDDPAVRGISVVCIQPGDINTGFTASREKQFIGDEIYNGRISRSVAVMEHDEQNGMSAETAGKFIAKVAAGNSKKPVRTIGMGYKAACLFIKLLPFRLSNKIIGMIYAK